MDLHKQSQEQSMNIDMSNQSMTPAECNYYQSPFNEMKRLDSSQTCTPQGQPLYEQDQQRLITTMSDNSNHNMNNSNSSSATSTPLPQSYTANNSDIMSVHTVLSQQSAEMNKMALQSPTTGNMASGNPQSMEHNLVNAGQSTMSSNNSPNPMMHSNLITNSDPNSLSSPQLSVPNNKMSNGLMDNNNLILSHENMFGITSSSNGMNVNHSPSFGYSEHSMQPTHVETQPELHSQAQLQAPPAPPAQAQLIIESQAGLEHHPVVPSQCNPQHTVSTQNQRAIEEEQERVAAAAQQVMAQRMAQQYAMMQHPNEHMMQQHQSNEHMVQQHQSPEQMMQQHQPTEHLLQHQPPEQMMQQHQPTEHLLQQHQPTEHMLQQHQSNEHLLQQHQSNEQMMQHQTTEHLLQHQSNEHMLQHQPTKHILQQHPPSEHLMQQHQPSEHLMQQHSMMVMKNESLPPHVPSHETPHVVLSQMSILSPSTPSPSVVNSMHAIKGTNLSLHNAVVHQQHQVQLEYENNKRPAEGPAFLERKKSRRHTVSNGSALNIDTKNLPTLSSCPRSAAAPFTRSEERKAFIDQQKKSLGMIDIPPPPTLHELGIGWVHAKDYDGLSRAQLISRLIELETEKKVSEKTSPENQEVKAVPEEDKSTEDEEEEEEMLEEQEKSQKMQCKWRECGLLFDGLQNLIAHINFEHVKSGKVKKKSHFIQSV